MTDSTNNEPSKEAYCRLAQVIRRLRSENGCPWDKEQTPLSFHPYILEEYHELVQAINHGEKPEMADEVGDLLFLVVFVAHMFEQEGFTTLSEIIEGSVEKMVRRHPHVFSTDTAQDSDEVLANWQKIKSGEESIKKRRSALDGVPRSLPGLARAQRITKRARSVGFDWQDPMDVFEKIEEEVREFKEAVESGDQADMEKEMGDLLFVMVNAARLFNINAESSVNAAADKFESRFRFIEAELAKQGLKPEEVELEVMDELWDRAKEKGM